LRAEISGSRPPSTARSPLLPVSAANGAPVAFALSAVAPPANLSLDLVMASALKVAAILADGFTPKQQASAPGVLPTGNLHDRATHHATLVQLKVASVYPHAFFSAYA